MSKTAKYRPTASKEENQFREALKLYDSKQYKKSLKVIDGVLKKNPHHAESLALKGLALYYSDTDKESAESYITRALEKDSTNNVVNHIAGIYYRAVKNYKEAAKWYQAAMDHGSTNKSILRDLSSMQSQIRDFKNLPKSRLGYLEDQPGYRANWTASAVAHQLHGDLANAEKVLGRIEDLIRDKLQESDYFEHSECLLYRNDVIAQMGDYEAALKDLERIEATNMVLDGLSLLEKRADYLMKLNRKKEASLVYRKLLKRNPDNAKYYYQLEDALGVRNSPRVRLALYEKLASFYPKSDPPNFIPLTFLAGEEFKQKAKNYVLGQLRRGVPSTFVNVKPLYKNNSHAATIYSIVSEFFETVHDQPLTYCWTAYFLAQHHYHVGSYSEALKMIELAINHTPTLVELYILKARIYKRMNELDQAASVMNEGLKLDLQDRFINTKTTKYYLRADNVHKAIDTISVFTKNDDSPNGLRDLHLMQSIWFIVESAESYLRKYRKALGEHNDTEAKTNLGLAFKRYVSLTKIFEEFSDDQVDFHHYCMRKGTPRAYLTMIDWADNLFDQPMYNRVLDGLSESVLEAVRHKELFLTDHGHKKLKKEEIRKREELVQYSQSVAEDDDVFGEKALQEIIRDEKLDVLVKQQALLHQQDAVFTQVFNFRVNFQLKKYVLCLQSLNKLLALDKRNPFIGYMVDQLRNHLAESTPDTIKKIVSVGLMKNFNKADTATLLETYFGANDLETALVLARMSETVFQTRLSEIKEKLDPYSRGLVSIVQLSY
ncbi:hypothetical protein KL928_000415 [Ogataea angusta]|uniref:Uncharacterized protein n=1 Tax=Pichia angusta TaxID=870730 RepID=A0AAN6DK06_PICAN|nr:uncharacterized protein KL928_000415 [Ogataea angusta]KAG7821940.1 hypothetical protein KL928_000415 [Ogataea angusta]KAG7837231.1 hypothetical protein KL943_001270 [Ogataea angusta]